MRPVCRWSAFSRAALALAVVAFATSCTQDFGVYEPLPTDAGTADTGTLPDGAAPPDAASDAPASDTGIADTGTDTDTGTDAGSLDAGLVAYYKFDEGGGTTCADSSGNNHTATLVGGGTFTSGLQNNAVTLSGNGQYVDLPNGLMGGLTSFSISAWVNLTTAPTWVRVFDLGSSTTKYFFLTPNSQSATTRFAITTAGNGNEQRVEGAALSTGSWQHVVVTLAGTTGTLYVNGTSIAQGPITLTPSDIGVMNSNYLGRSQFVSDPYLSGQIDNVRIYSRALDSSEVQQLFQQKL